VQGCEKSLEEWITGHVYIFIGVVVGIILIEVISKFIDLGISILHEISQWLKV